METLPILRRLLFPAPIPPLYEFDTYPENTIWIPPISNPSSSSSSSFPSSSASFSASSSASSSSSSSSSHAALGDIPCFYLPHKGSDILVVFSHGNGTDIGGMYDILMYYKYHWKVSVLLWEYPGYGVFEGVASEPSINLCIRSVLRFVVEQIRFPLERVILYGQSIGTGPTCHLAASMNDEGIHLGGIILHSPYTCIKDVVKFLAGRIAAAVVPNRWNNLECVKRIVDPILIIHGTDDNIIPVDHSEKLYAACISENKHLLIVNQADHNNFDIIADVIRPCQQFLDLYLRGKKSSSTSTLVRPLEVLDKKWYSVPSSVIAAYMAKVEQERLKMENQHKNQQRKQAFFNFLSNPFGSTGETEKSTSSSSSSSSSAQPQPASSAVALDPSFQAGSFRPISAPPPSTSRSTSLPSTTRSKSRSSKSSSSSSSSSSTPKSPSSTLSQAASLTYSPQNRVREKEMMSKPLSPAGPPTGANRPYIDIDEGLDQADGEVEIENWLDDADDSLPSTPGKSSRSSSPYSSSGSSSPEPPALPPTSPPPVPPREVSSQPSSASSSRPSSASSSASSSTSSSTSSSPVNGSPAASTKSLYNPFKPGASLHQGSISITTSTQKKGRYDII